MKIFKYEFPPEDYVGLMLPKGARILSVQTQREKPCLWALVDPFATPELRRFRLAGTGHIIHEESEKLIYIETFQMLGGSLVFHIFEVIN